MKRIFSIMLVMMFFTMAACGTKKEEAKEVTLTAPELLEQLKEALGESYSCDTADDETQLENYFGLDLSKIDSYASESNAMYIDQSKAIILKVQDGYAEEAAECLRKSYEQTVNFSQMYHMDVHRVGQARLFVQGNYVALLILGQQGDYEASEEEQAKFALAEYEKVDAAWKEIFGVLPENQAVKQTNTAG
ncbi:MAG: DUF4358 domain-containing protein [Lachnospiraceae bacterium]